MTTLNTLIARIRNRQDLFFSGKGKFFQGLRIPAIDCDGVTDQQIDQTRHPGDQVETWNDFDSTSFRSNTKIPYNITLHIYHGPQGDGWILVVEIWYASLDPDQFGNYGDHWFYQHHEGPEVRTGIWDQWYLWSGEA